LYAIQVSILHLTIRPYLATKAKKNVYQTHS
jgi:hypothetical protein